MNRFVLFFLVLSVGMSLMGWYVHRRASDVFRLGRRARIALALVLVAGFSTFFARRLIGGDDTWLRELAIVGTGFSMAIVLATGLLFHVDLVSGLWWLGERLFGLKRQRPGVSSDASTFDVEAAELGALARDEQGALRATAPAARVDHATSRGSDVATRGSDAVTHASDVLASGSDAATHVLASGSDAATLASDVAARASDAATHASGMGRPADEMERPSTRADANADATSPAFAFGRRAFVRHASAGAIAVGTGGSFYAALFGRRDYTIDEVPVVLRGLPRALDGLTIVQLSDIHVGTFIGERELRAATSLVREARPDLIVLTGDLLDHDAAYAPVLGRWVEAMRPIARFGVAAIPGNHDHYAGVDEVEEALVRAGAHLMTNAGRLVGDGGGAFGLLGVDDVWARGEGRRPDLSRALAMVPPDVPKVLLAHQPVFMEEAVGKVDLQLSGHTHGGQVSLGWNPAQLVLPNGWVRGRYDVGESVLYVNRGFGTAGPPARLFSPPEVTKLVLVAG